MNKIILCGRLCAEPEVKTTTNGTAIVEVNLAVDRPFQKGGQKEVDFIPLQAWRQTAEFIGQHFHKGSQILLEGKLQSRSYEDKQGNKRTLWNVVVDNVEFFGEKKAEPQHDNFVDAPDDEDIPF